MLLPNLLLWAALYLPLLGFGRFVLGRHDGSLEAVLSDWPTVGFAVAAGFAVFGWFVAAAEFAVVGWFVAAAGFVFGPAGVLGLDSDSPGWMESMGWMVLVMD